MSTEDYKAPDEIEEEIEHTRSEMRETLDAIQSKITPGQIVEDVMSYFREGPGEFASNLGRAVRENPVPVALIGAGIAWLAMSGARRRLGHEGDQYEYEGDQYDYDEEQSYYAGAGGGDYLAAAGAESAAYTSTGGVYHPTSGSSVGSYGSMGGTGSGSQSGELGSGPGESMGSSYYYDEGSYGQERRGRIGRMTGSVRERMSRMGGTAREQAYRARTGMSDMIEEQPLMMAAAAFVLGAAIGAMLPSTRREDRMMGGTRDELTQRATEMGREGLHRAQEAARESWTSVTDEMLNPEASSETAGKTASEAPQASTSTQRGSSAAAPSTSTSTSGGASAKSEGASGTTTPSGTERKS